MVETDVAGGLLRARAPGTRWLVTGHDGGFRDADAAYNVSVPAGFDREDLAAYVRERRERAGFPTAGPALLTGVSMTHARGARAGPVEAIATAGLSNPARLPLDPGDDEPGDAEDGETTGDAGQPGTVNLLVTTTQALTDGGLASLLAATVEAKTATLHALTGFSGTTSDGAVVGSTATGGDPAAFAGSVTEVGGAARACVREAVTATLRSRYPENDYPTSVADAEYGVETSRVASVFRVD